jgi:exonuclease SbcC
MNTSSLRNIIEKRFEKETIEVKPDVFRITSRFKEKDFAAHYFDCSKSFLADGFDLNEYQQLLLADDYYANNGPLQWNYYLYFVSDTAPSIEKKLVIEDDKAFSRKFVTTPEELVRLIELQQRLREKPKDKLDTALVTVWKTRLKDAGLSGIYLVKDYPKIPEVFQRFVDGDELPETIESDREVGPSEITTSPISELTFQGFRSFKKGDFRFKTVNLIRGVNGAGKTSLMEAIELALCGQTIESRNKKEVVGSLQVKLTNGQIDKYTPDDNKKFQARDRNWYGNNILKGNSLSQGFHIYNFFDSDAAFRFTNESDSGEAVKQIFSRIVLGEEANVIFDRIERFNERLVIELRGMQKQRNQYEDERLTYQAKLKEFDSSSEVITALGNLIVVLNDMKWKGADLLLGESSNRISFQTQLSTLNKALYEINEINWISPLNPSTIDDDDKVINSLLDQIAVLQNSFEEDFKTINEAERSIEVLTDQLKIAERAQRYFTVDNISELAGLSQRLANLRSIHAKTQEALTLLRSALDSTPKSIQAVIEAQENLSKEKLVQAQELREKLIPLERALGALNKIKVAMITNAEELIHLTGESSSCPLCQTSFPSGDILQIIAAATTELKDAEIVKQYTSSILQAEKEIEMSGKVIEKMESIRAFFQQFTFKEIGFTDDTVLGILIERLDAVIVEIVDEGKRARQLSDTFSQLDISEKEFLSIQDELSLLEIHVNSNTSAAEFSEILQGLTEKRQGLVQHLKSLQQVRNEKEHNVIQAVATYFKDSQISYRDIDKVIEKLLKRKEQTAAAARDFKEINRYVEWKQDDNVRDVKIQFDHLTSLFQTYIEIETQNKLKKEYLDKLNGIKINLENLQAKSSRFDNAGAVLGDIITNNNRENYLKEFFSQNKASILDVFKVIHTPNEFDDILFESSDVIKLKVKNRNELRDLTEISTGQKSAFILSLFLSLNSNLVSGPPLILFDDPIAYVDDINTLSFLDFLRETILAKDRQLFFATANNKLANLFQQKFSFLGDDLQVIRLDKITNAQV